MTNAYAGLTTLKSAGVLNITGAGFDDRLLALLEDVSRQIDGYCNRHFYVLTTTATGPSGGCVSSAGTGPQRTGRSTRGRGCS